MDRNQAPTNVREAEDQRNMRNWKAAAVRLWQLLDDLDTADDVAKADDATYRRIAQSLQRARFAIVSGDEIDRARHASGVSASDCESVIMRASPAPPQDKGGR
jgi:hypothetical protein